MSPHNQSRYGLPLEEILARAAPTGYVIDRARSNSEDPQFIFIEDPDHKQNHLILELLVQTAQKGESVFLESGTGEVLGMENGELIIKRDGDNERTRHGFFSDQHAYEQLRDRGVQFVLNDDPELLTRQQHLGKLNEVASYLWSANTKALFEKIEAESLDVCEKRSQLMIPYRLERKGRSYQVAGNGHFRDGWYAAFAARDYATLTREAVGPAQLAYPDRR